MSSSTSTCSHWWHAPIYVAAAIAVVIAATSSSFSHSSNEENPTVRIPGDLPPGASVALHRSGFHLTAEILRISLPHEIDGPATTFAAPDSAVANLSLSAARLLLRRHTVPLRLDADDLLALPRGASLPTLLPPHRLVVTESDGRNRSVAVNGVHVTFPDLFVSGPHVIHGVNGPLPHGPSGPVRKAPVQWDRLVRFLGSRGYVSFSAGLTAVLDDLAASRDRVTVFAPKGGGFDHVAASPLPAVESAVRRHVAVGRFRYGELAAMRTEDGIRTLAGEDLRITAVVGDDGKIAINGVDVTEPEVYVADGVVVHGIARAFDSM